MDLNINIKFLNSLWETPPPWATELKEMVAELAEKGLLFMANAEEKLAELEAKAATTATAIEGIRGDFQVMSDKATADAAEIAALKQAVIDAQSNAGELSPELAARFDALIASAQDTAQKATDLDAKLPNVPPANPFPDNPNGTA